MESLTVIYRKLRTLKFRYFSHQPRTKVSLKSANQLCEIIIINHAKIHCFENKQTLSSWVIRSNWAKNIFQLISLSFEANEILCKLFFRFLKIMMVALLKPDRRKRDLNTRLKTTDFWL